jgi:predicted GIY-YIG superfamily endonuclease
METSPFNEAASRFNNNLPFFNNVSQKLPSSLKPIRANTQMTDLIEQINTLFVNVTNIKDRLNYMKKILTIDSENEEIVRETEMELKRVRRFFETTTLGSSMFPFGTQYIYVWELEEGKFYVGWSENLSRRLDEHLSEEGAIWTKKYKPVSIMEVCRGDKSVEKQKTLEYMKLKGWENVRGGPWCYLDYKTAPPEVAKFCAS